MCGCGRWTGWAAIAGRPSVSTAGGPSGETRQRPRPPGGALCMVDEATADLVHPSEAGRGSSWASNSGVVLDRLFDAAQKLSNASTKADVDATEKNSGRRPRAKRFLFRLCLSLGLRPSRLSLIGPLTRQAASREWIAYYRIEPVRPLNGHVSSRATVAIACLSPWRKRHASLPMKPADVFAGAWATAASRACRRRISCGRRSWGFLQGAAGSSLNRKR